jgi:hypothetical protein
VTDERLEELQRLADAVLEARRARDAVPTYVEEGGRTYIDARPEVWRADRRLADAEKEYELAIGQGGHELIAEVRRLRAELAARDDRWQSAVGMPLERVEELAAEDRTPESRRARPPARPRARPGRRGPRVGRRV